MNIDDLLNNSETANFAEVVVDDYTDADAILMVECIMSRNISTEWILKCVTSIALNLGLDEEVEIVELEQDEDDPFSQMSEGPMTYQTSEFVEWVGEATNMLLIENNYKKFIQFYYDSLLDKEKYEILGRLELERRYGCTLEEKRHKRFFRKFKKKS